MINLNEFINKVENLAKRRITFTNQEARSLFCETLCPNQKVALTTMINEIKYSRNRTSYLPLADVNTISSTCLYYLNVMIDGSESMRSIEPLIRDVIREAILPALNPENKHKRQPRAGELYTELSKYNHRVESMIPYTPYQMINNFDSSLYYTGGKRDVLSAFIHQITSLHYQRMINAARGLHGKAYALLIADGDCDYSLYNILQAQAVYKAAFSDEFDTNVTIIATNPNAVNLFAAIGLIEGKEIIFLNGKDANSLDFAAKLQQVVHDSIKHMLTRKYYVDGSGKYYASHLSA